MTPDKDANINLNKDSVDSDSLDSNTANSAVGDEVNSETRSIDSVSTVESSMNPESIAEEIPFAKSFTAGGGKPETDVKQLSVGFTKIMAPIAVVLIVLGAIISVIVVVNQLTGSETVNNEDTRVEQVETEEETRHSQYAESIFKPLEETWGLTMVKFDYSENGNTEPVEIAEALSIRDLQDSPVYIGYFDGTIIRFNATFDAEGNPESIQYMSDPQAYFEDYAFEEPEK